MKKDDVNNITGCILSDLRKSTGLTQKEFAKAFNVSEGTIAHYEQGITIPNSEMLLQYANFSMLNIICKTTADFFYSMISQKSLTLVR